jgi:alpha-ketoglutarate-dependent taurine dioxygenase
VTAFEPVLATPSGRVDVDAALAARGAVLFRGFPIGSAEGFERFARAITPALVDYEFGSTPRSRIHGRIYTSTEYPAHQPIPLHNEQSYTTEWPLKIWFHCVQPAAEGGQTTLADSRAVYLQIPARIREVFEARRVLYVRNYGGGLDLPWQKVFGTEDRGEVERFCRRAGIAYEWRADGELRTRQVCQTIAAHPQSGEVVWFNQAHLFHVSSLDPRTREGLLAALPESELPRNAYFGDGARIDDGMLDEIRGAYAQLAGDIAWRAGDVVLADNMRVAHGRAPYRGPRKVLVAMAEPYRAAAEQAP